MGMIVCYMRSSSYGCYSMCQQQYFIEYNLGIKGNSNKSAVKGTVTHRCMQLLADQKLAMNDGKDSFEDDDFGHIEVDKCDDFEYVTDLSWDLYTPDEPHLNFTKADKRDCLKWLHKATEHMDGAFDPRKQKIVEAEKFFDFEIHKKWAAYKYEVNGETIEGHLALKGTVDLIIEHEDCYECIDYKTGARKNWATGEEYTLDKLNNNHQLLMYYYALRRDFADKPLLMSIYYINTGGVFTLGFDDNDLDRAEGVIRKRYEEIKKNTKPQLLTKDTWKCSKLCHFGKNSFEGKSETMCQTIHKHTQLHGIEGSMEKYGDMDKITKYGDGGGKKNVE